MKTMESDGKASHAEVFKDRDAVLRELSEILASPHFSNSKRYPAMLKFLVESTLAGKEDILKERTIGIEVFHRPPTYDTNADTIVRFTAGEVRKRLSSYYHEEGRTSPLRISLPPGSYVPEFLDGIHQRTQAGDNAISSSVPLSSTDDTAQVRDVNRKIVTASPTSSPATPGDAVLEGPQIIRGKAISKGFLWTAVAAIVILAVAACLIWRFRPAPPQTATDDLWQPLLRGPKVVFVCTGTTTLSQNDPNDFSGIRPAGDTTKYPLVSLQTASAISLVDYQIERRGVLAELHACAATPLSELRENAIVLLTAYENPWTMRFAEPLRFHFAPAPDYAIVDRNQPQVRWARDPSVPYSSADDYALVARFWNKDTDNWVVVLAGLGRNGTEAAAQFAVSPKQIRRLREYIGRDFSKENVEAVLKVSVVDGKTGAPTIVGAYVW